MSAQSQYSSWKRTVWSLAIAEIIVWAGTYYMFPALLPHWEHNLGWSKTELSAAFTSALIVSALAAPFTGRLIDQGHGRKVLTISAFTGGILVCLLSQVEHFWQFYALWIAIGIAMAGSLYEPCFAYLTHLLGYDAKKAITLITLIAGFAGTVSFPTAHFLAETIGWRGGVIVFAGAICCIATPLMWFSNSGSLSQDSIDFHSSHRKHVDGTLKRALRSPVFWLLGIAFSMIALNHGMLITHLLPLLGERGIYSETAVLAASMIGPMQVAGRLAMMAMERHVSVAMVCATSFLFLIAAAAVLFGVGAIAVLLVGFVILQGSGYGVTSITRPLITADYLGRSGFGVISGAQAIMFVGASALAPTVAALLWETGGYDIVIIACAAAAVIGLLAFIAASRIKTPLPQQRAK